MEQSRIIDFPEATAPAADDYLLMDSETNGTQKLLVSKIGGGGSVKNPNYNWFTNQDETLIVRQTIATGAFRWYFKDFVVTEDLYMPVPANLQRFILNNVGAYCFCNDYTEDYNGIVGFYGDTIRLWTVGLSSNMAGTINTGIIESTDSGFENTHTWVEPTFDPING